MSDQDLREKARKEIQKNRDQMDVLKRRFREGKIDREQYLERLNEYKARTKGIQSVFN